MISAIISESTLDKLRALIDADQLPLPDNVALMADAIRKRHGDAVLGLVFYGSAMREADDPEKMLDFYVIVKSYRSVYPNPLLRLATALLPPGVHLLQISTPDGHKLRSKYAIVSERAFYRRAGGEVLESMLWARFVQPAVIVADDAQVYSRVRDTFARACAHFYQQAAPLAKEITDPGEVWVRGLAESYRTELRPEKPYERAREIVARYPERYAHLTEILNDGRSGADRYSGAARFFCRARWTLRRICGKPRGAGRVLKAALTFEGGLDYILEKVGNHSGVHLDVSDRARRHPLLFAPVIAWRLYRAGAFR